MTWQRKGTPHSPRTDRFKRPYQRAREKRTATEETTKVHEPSVHTTGVHNDHSVERPRLK